MVNCCLQTTGLYAVPSFVLFLTTCIALRNETIVFFSKKRKTNQVSDVELSYVTGVFPQDIVLDNTVLDDHLK
jgi:hypothetical protein